ncbi:hypothetical protein [Clavibacter michiganensis]|nr:hypothetical protein [Clavibacter michiganensis]
MTTTQPSYGDDELWTCAVAPSCIPDEPGGTLNGLSDCSGCGNQMWVGYAPWSPDEYDLDGALERLIHGGANDNDGKALAAALAELYELRARDKDRLARDRRKAETSEREIAPFVPPPPPATRSTTP